MLTDALEYIKNLLGAVVRLVLATLFTALLNLLLFYVGLFSLDMVNETRMGEYFSRLHPQVYHLLVETLALTPYWPNSLKFALAAMLCALAASAVAQMLGIRRLLFTPLPLLMKGLWAVGLSMLLAVPMAQYDARLDSWHAYAVLLLPGMFCVLFPVMRAAGCLLPDMTALIAGPAARR